eukprot:m.207805 g.207805  ORF g.207805 m.207805 type:complete len:175 (+) comp25404_c0_seq3:1221-1745(+)
MAAKTSAREWHLLNPERQEPRNTAWCLITAQPPRSPGYPNGTAMVRGRVGRDAATGTEILPAIVVAGVASVTTTVIGAETDATVAIAAGEAIEKSLAVGETTTGIVTVIVIVGGIAIDEIEAESVTIEIVVETDEIVIVTVMGLDDVARSSTIFIVEVARSTVSLAEVWGIFEN